jgi:CheY-like chemotaxis protein
VVGNLVQNAGKYTPDGGRIAVALSQDNGAAVLRIIDTGAGIPTSQLDAVFEMFTQVDRTLDRSRGGLGIGLSLVRRLVELHGGTVTAHSLGVGTGSTFTVRLPMVTPDANEGPDADLKTNSPATRRLNILVVDDNRDLADGLSALLAHHGHRVKTAYNGGGALEMADGFHLDIVFCDIGMAGANGHEVARALRAGVGGKALLLVAVTGWGSQEDRRLSFDAGFDIHLTKPVSAEQVEGILARF